MMCNLGEGIEERATERATKIAIERTTEQIILNMYEKGCSLELISDVTKKNIEDVKIIIEKEMVTA